MLCIIYINFIHITGWVHVWAQVDLDLNVIINRGAKRVSIPRFFGSESSDNQVNRGPLISPSVGYIVRNPITAYRYVTLVKKINRRILAIEKEVLHKLTRTTHSY